MVTNMGRMIFELNFEHDGSSLLDFCKDQFDVLDNNIYNVRSSCVEVI